MSGAAMRLRRYAAWAPRGARLVRHHLASRPQQLWLTFDDGPHPRHTVAILEALARHRLRATFFVIGSRAREFMPVVRQAAAAGHRIGNHSYSHPRLSELPAATVRDEILRTEELIAPYLGAQKLFRPPYGARNATVDAITAGLGYRTLLWSLDTLDWQAAFQPARWARRAARRVWLQEAPLLLMHDDRPGTAATMEGFLAHLVDSARLRVMPPETL